MGSWTQWSNWQIHEMRKFMTKQFSRHCANCLRAEMSYFTIVWHICGLLFSFILKNDYHIVLFIFMHADDSWNINMSFVTKHTLCVCIYEDATGFIIRVEQILLTVVAQITTLCRRVVSRNAATVLPFLIPTLHCTLNFWIWLESLITGINLFPYWKVNVGCVKCCNAKRTSP